MDQLPFDATAALSAMPLDELRSKVDDSLLESMVAFRFSIEQIEKLDGYRKLLRDILEDARVVVAAHGPKPLVKRIDKALGETVT